jgi:pyridoxal phosphate enzyme (YggS family)
MMTVLELNLAEIQENIERAAQKAGRKAGDITLVGVSKTIPIKRIKEAFDLGLLHFGENRVQELLPKYEAFSTPSWHMIGHLQTNKVKFIVEKVKLIHSVDSLRLAQEINKRAEQHNIKIDVLIEINIAEEDTKHGVASQNAVFLLEQMQQLPNICTKGLMCVAPYVEIPEQNRKYFEKLNTLFVDISTKKMHNVDMRFLSMGMTGDYQVAVEEGANIVRVGTGLFGNRQ